MKLNLLNNKNPQQIKLILIAIIGIFLIIFVTMHGVSRLIQSDHIIRMNEDLSTLKEEIDFSYFSGIENVVDSLSLNDCVQELLINKTIPENHHVSNFLNTIINITDASLVYVMDAEGTVVSSTVYDVNKTLIGNNYAFRPYFKQAMQGNTTIYPAIGITTNQRGIYYSAPVRRKNTESIIGVVVIKKGLEQLDAIVETRSHPTVIISPEGIIFSTNQDDLYHSLQPLSEELIDEINITKQYAGIPITPLQIDFKQSTLTINDQEYIYLNKPLSIESWSLFTYESNDYNVFWILSEHYLFIFIFSFIVIIIFLACLQLYNSMLKLQSTKLELKKVNKSLKNHKEALEKTVEERTKDLTLKNQELQTINLKLSSTEQKLMELNARLEQKVIMRTEEIQELLDQKIKFINHLGHDIKTPLSPLINLIPILEQTEEDPQKKEILQVLDRNVRYMKNLVTNTLEFSRLKSPKTEINVESLHLKSEVDEIIENKSFQIDDKLINITNNLSDSLTVNVDKLKIQEVFNNIISNAVKYSSDEHVSINIGETSIQDDFATIEITDNGIGMTAEQKEHIFEEFYKADPARHDFESSGLGMSITKRIIEMHGGKIWVKSDGVGKGSSVYFSLPLKI